MYYIYRITNLVNGKTYIGQRKYKKLNDDYMGSGKRLKSAIKKYGIENFKKDILVFNISKKEHVDILEKTFIASEREKVGKENCYNIADGGEGGSHPAWNKGKKMPEETRRKNSEAHKGRPGYWQGKQLSEEHKKSLSESWDYDKHFTEETRKKISEAGKGNQRAKGKHHTEEWKRKMSKVHKENMKEIREAYKKSGRKDWNTFQKEYKKGDR